MKTKISNKPAAAGVATNLAVVLVWAAEQFDLSVPSPVAAALASLLIAGAYWVVPASD